MLELSIEAHSKKGLRDENQDNYLIIDQDGYFRSLKNEKIDIGIIPNWPQQCTRLAVADGMGGHQSGREVAESLIEHLKHLPFQADVESFKMNLEKIHQDLFDKYHQGKKSAGSTLVMADIDDKGNAVIACVGDSRIYQNNGNSWNLLSRDHTILEFQWRDEEISSLDYNNHLQTDNHALAQAMGFGSSGIIPHPNGQKYRQHNPNIRIEVGLDIKRIQLTPNQILYLASDGLWNQQIKYTPKNLTFTECDRLIEQAFSIAESAKSQDNMTAIFACFN